MPDVKAGAYADILEEMQRRWTYSRDQLQTIIEEAKIDMRYVSGNPWDDADRRQREDAGRPVLALDELGQYTNQLINDVRQHKRAIKVTPIGSGANDDTAELRADLIREIEYRSNAQQAYTCGFENTVNRSYGFWKVKAKYATTPQQSGGSGAAFNQELVITPIVNPDTVTVDPDALRPDGSDMKYAWETETWSYEDYRKAFPDARVQDFDAQLAKQYPTWMTVNRIQLAQYWNIETDTRTLLLFKGLRPLPDGSQGDLEVFEDDLKSEQFASLEKFTPDRERKVEVPIVQSYLTNGFEVLGKPDRWPGKSIPIVCCYGKVLYVDDGSGSKKQMLSLVRLARDPYMLYCYYRTTEAELIGMTPKVPYFVRRGSLKPDQLLNLQKSLHEPIAVIEVEGSSDSMPAGQPPEMPQRNPYVPEIQAMEMGAEGARRAIQAAMGISPLPTAAQRQTEKSGVALKQIHDAEQQGSFHFIDSYEAAITRTGAILNEVLDVYYDTARDVTVRNGKGEPSQVRINDPMAEGGEKRLGSADEHDVTLSTGPSYDSEREAANDYADLLTQNVQMVAQVSGPQAAAKLLSMAVKLKNLGPIGDEIADLLAPPQPEGGLPPQIQQAMQQLQGENQQLKQAVATDQAKQQAMLQKAQMDNASAEKIAAQKTDADLKKQWIAISAQLLIAAGKVGAENARSLAEALDKKDAEAIGAILDVIHKDKDQIHEHVQGQLDRTHDVNMAVLAHQQALQQSTQDHQEALDQGDQGHQQALEQGQQAADLAPEPAAAE
jgi:hypothetical protein